MLRGGCLWLAALWLAGGSPPPERGPPLRVPHDHSHGFAYDHEAVLGPEQARAFDQLSPEESRHRLGLLVGLMDGDGDGAVSLAELRGWLLRTRGRARAEELQRGRERYDQNGDGAVSWDEYRGEAYGNPEDGFGDGADPAAYGALLARDRRRFEAADRDGDGVAAGPELEAFLHPEDFEHMRDIVLKETMEDMDKDEDGFIQLEEYIAELYSPEPGVPEPSWVAEERAQFRGGRDVDGDGRLSPPEVGQWLRPPSSDWAGHEAAHLLHASDRDQDGRLSKEEILGNWEMFVGSQATNYGEDLGRPHDEL